jgi:cytochrome c oxidase subunit 3
MTTHVATAHGQAAAPHGEGMNRGMFGMVLFIASEIMLFGGLFAGYFYVRNQADTWPPEGIEHTPSIGFAVLLSVLLVASGIFGHMGLIAMRTGSYGFGTASVQTGNRQGLLVGTGIAIILGTIFIILQAYEWLSLMDEGLTAKSGVFGSTFYILTGFHGAHVIAGLAMLAVVFVRALWRDFTPRRHLFADAAMLYWHFVDFVWLILVVVVYVTGT